jgi:hypothetical protein
MPTELQRKYNVDLDIYGAGPDRKPYYEMTEKAAYKILEVPVTLAQLKRSELLW